MDALKYQELDKLTSELDCESLTDVPLCKHTVFKIGGPAARLITVFSDTALSGILRGLTRLELPYFVLGKGSNLLVGDEGYPGVALKLEFTSGGLMQDGVTLYAGAGMSLRAACVIARDEGLTGLEFAWGIPGSVGGAVYMNAGAYGGEMSSSGSGTWTPRAGFWTAPARSWALATEGAPSWTEEKLLPVRSSSCPTAIKMR